MEHKRCLTFGLVFLALTCFLKEDPAEAARRRRSRSREPIIVHRLLNSTGTVLIDGVAAPEFSGLKEGQLIETKEDSSTVARIVGLGIFRVGENSLVKLQKFVNRDRLKMEVGRGDFLLFLKRPGSHSVDVGKSHIELQNEATLRVKFTGTEPAQICACKGTFKVFKANEPAPEPSASVEPTPVPISPAVCCAQIDLEKLESLWQLP